MPDDAVSRDAISKKVLDAEKKTQTSERAFEDELTKEVLEKAKKEEIKQNPRLAKNENDLKTEPPQKDAGAGRDASSREESSHEESEDELLGSLIKGNPEKGFTFRFAGEVHGPYETKKQARWDLREAYQEKMYESRLKRNSNRQANTEDEQEEQKKPERLQEEKKKKKEKEKNETKDEKGEDVSAKSSGKGGAGAKDAFISSAQGDGAHPVLFFIFIVVIPWLLIAYLGPSVFMYIVYGVLFFVLLPWVVRFFLQDDEPYLERMRNPTYAILSMTQMAVMLLYQSGKLLGPAVQTIMHEAGVLYPLIFLNAWGLYTLFTYGSQSKTLWLGRFAFILFVILLLLIQIFGFISANNLNVAGRNYGLMSLQATWQGVKDSWKKVTGAVPGAVNDIKDQINKSIAIATGQYYVGEVENGKNEPLGVYIQNLRPIDTIQLAGRPVTVLADVTGQSFQGIISVTVGCIAKSSGNKFYTGTVETGQPDAGPFQIVYKDTRTVYCTFNDLPPGTYSVQLSAEFPFQTWAYIPYTFVDQETYRSFYAQGKDINKELFIDQKPVAVYTAGPVSIGLQTQDQPVPLDTSPPKNNIEVMNANKAFGGTVENKWSEGVIKSVQSFVLKIPEPFSISKCYPADALVQNPPVVEGYKEYSFANTDPKITFSTVACRLQVSGTDAAELLSAKVKAEKTFVAEASYTYILTKTISIQVR